MTDEIIDWDKLQLEAAEAALKSKQALLDYVLQGEGYADLIAACDAALDWADANARWFDISTAPWLKDVDSEYDYRSPDSGNGIGQVYKTDLFDDEFAEWLPDVHVGDVFYQRNGAVSKPTHWRPLPPPPSNPPLPEPLEALGAVLRRVKGGE